MPQNGFTMVLCLAWLWIWQDKENDHAYIIEFKVHKPGKEKDLEQTLTNAHIQIEEKQYTAGLIAEGFAPERIRKYGIVFMGKECLIG